VHELAIRDINVKAYEKTAYIWSAVKLY